jgi:diaminohydroxyphosphoribosylaminopyrimidine deaminase / 5-amino-6-(5-phosphoribosylamino)uracil reductase
MMIATMTEAGQSGGVARPRVTLKIATSLDSKIATKSGASKWITGPQARAHVHDMRASHDCVLTGIGTVLADDPELTARLEPAPRRQPVRAVLDSSGRTPPTAKLLSTLHRGPVCLFHDHEFTGAVTGASHHKVTRRAGGLDLVEVLSTLAGQYGVTSVMVEAGGQVAGSFLNAGMVDQIVWFRAPILIGGDGISVFDSLGVEGLSDALAFDCVDISACGRDHMETYLALGQNKG